jgi:hypothetical protein
MTLQRKYIYFFLTLFLLLCSFDNVFSLEVNKEGESFFQYSVYENFYALTNSPNPNILIYCNDDHRVKSIHPKNWSLNSKIFSLDLKTLDCFNFKLYDLNEDSKNNVYVSVKKEISIPEKILDQKKVDNSFGDFVETAQAIAALQENSDYEKELVLALDYLKANRHEKYKCWPVENCDIYTTAKVLAFLKLANQEETKLFNDARLWLDSRKNTPFTDWNIKIFGKPNMNCTLKIGNSNMFFELEENTYEHTFVPKNNDLIDVNCSESFAFIITENSSVIYSTLRNSKHFEYTIPDSCWAKSKQWQTCDLETTLLANFVSKSKSAVVDENILTDRIVGKKYDDFDFDNAIKLASYHLMFHSKNDDILNWLLYSQNNNGFFGKDEKELTASVLFAIKPEIQKSLVKESYDAGLKWLSSNYEEINSMEGLFFAYSALKLKDNLIYSEPQIIDFTPNKTTDSFKITLFNPTKDELEVKIINHLPFMKIKNLSDENITTISANDKIELNYEYNTLFKSSIYFSNISFFIDDEFKFSIPVKVTLNPFLNYLKSDEFIQDRSGKLSSNLRFSKSPDNFECIIDSKDEVLSFPKFFIIDSLEKPIVASFDNSYDELIKDSVSFELVCELKEPKSKLAYNKTIKINKNYVIYPKDLFNVYPEKIEIVKRTEDFSIEVENLVDEDVELSVSLKRGDLIYTAQERVKLLPLEKKPVVFNIMAPLDDVDNFTISDIITVRKDNLSSKDVIVTVMFSDNPLFSIIKTVLLILGISILIFILRKKIVSLVKFIFRSMPDSLVQKMPNSIKTIFDEWAWKGVVKNKSELKKYVLSKEKDFIYDIKGIIKVKKMLGKAKFAIIEDLKSKGFKEDYINIAFQELENENTSPEKNAK